MTDDSQLADLFQPSIRASIVLRDFGMEPAKVTEILGIAPSGSGRSGDPLHKPDGTPSSRRVRQTYWSVRSTVDPQLSLDEHIRSILDQLRGKEDRFHALPAGTTIKLKCTVFPEDEMPVLSVDWTLMQSLVTLHATLEIDVVRVDDADGVSELVHD